MVDIVIGCVLCDVQDHAEEKFRIEHLERKKERKNAEPDGKTPMYEINARLFLVIKNYR